MAVILMRGDSVTVIRPVEVGTDSHGNPTYDEEIETVENVLMRPNLGDDGSNANVAPYSTETAVTFAFPKSYGGKSLKGCRIYAPLYDKTFYVVDDPLPILHNCPTAWNYLVKGVCKDGQ